MATLDLNLLYILVALDECRSVSAAARKLHRSQPGVSVALSKLRAFFGDPLFVRSGNGMEPTPRATTLIESARSVLARIGSDIVAEPAFDPAKSSKPVTLVLSDVGEVVLLPKLLMRVREGMPNAMVQSITLPASEVGPHLESGEVDLAVGYFPDLKKHNFYQQALYTDTFASLIRSGHRVRAAKLSIKEYLQLEHAVVRAESRTEEVIESYLARKKIRRRVVLATPHFASVPIIIAQSDLIATIPEPLARYFSALAAGVRVVQLPFDPPRIGINSSGIARCTTIRAVNGCAPWCSSCFRRIPRTPSLRVPMACAPHAEEPPRKPRGACGKNATSVSGPAAADDPQCGAGSVRDAASPQKTL